ncbi:hypothetical protein [Desulforamulus aquiferis]|uniref:hypothetical protein n=1 Tax=Desulforamulus aquiferis TaxID=1397668 RepID=UPI001024FD87|nr:hypothetical protein [Desulforamulus aquiferis]RYD06915.1 hypothetical protein N752_01945 [Desulforamulus aquiferis]
MPVRFGKVNDRGYNWDAPIFNSSCPMAPIEIDINSRTGGKDKIQHHLGNVERSPVYYIPGYFLVSMEIKISLVNVNQYYERIGVNGFPMKEFGLL